MSAVLCASRARAPAAVKLKPGGVISPFCEPAIATSTPHASISNGKQRVGERDQRAGIDVDRRLLHGGEHGVRDDGRARDREEFTAGGEHGGPYAGKIGG